MNKILGILIVFLLGISLIPSVLGTHVNGRDTSIDATLSTTGDDSDTLVDIKETFTFHIEDTTNDDEWVIYVNITVPMDFTIETESIIDPSSTEGYWRHAVIDQMIAWEFVHSEMESYGDNTVNSEKGGQDFSLNATAPSMTGTYFWEVEITGDGYNEPNPTFDLITLESTVSEPPPIAEWTFMVYLDGDCDLEKFAISDINEMEEIGSTDDVNIIAFVDRWDGTEADEQDKDDTSNGDWTNAVAYRISKDYDNTIINSEILAEYEEINMGDPDTLVMFVNHTIEQFTADKYALIFWNHGDGWPGVCHDDSHICDDGSDKLTLYELESSLEDIKTINDGKKLDIIGFDACLMGMIEVAHSIAPFGKYMVGSEETEPGDGLLYTRFLNDLVLDPSMSAEDFSSLMVTSFVESYTDGKNGPEDVADVTQSAIKLDAIQDVVTGLDSLSIELKANIDSVNEDVARARYTSEEYGKCSDPDTDGPDSEYIDLYQFLDHLREISDDSTLDTIINEIIDDINTAVIEEGHGDDHYQSHGISIYFPECSVGPTDCEGGYDEDYNDITFSIDTHWDEFLLAFYHSFPNSPPKIVSTSPEPDLHSDEYLIDYIEIFKGASQEFTVEVEDPDGNEVIYHWELIYDETEELIPTSDDGSSIDISFDDFELGWYTLSMETEDEFGYHSNAGSYKWYIFLVENPNTAPRISSFTPNQTTISVIEGGIVTFIISTIDDEGDELSYIWLIDDETGQEFQYMPDYNSSGSHIISVEVSDEWAFVDMNWTVIVLEDSDEDGVQNSLDAFPNDPNETKDSDGDGVGDNSDAFPDDPNEWIDTDGDGVGDNSDAFPNDPNETKDSDGDGVGDNSDAFPDDPAASIDSDGDRYPDEWNLGCTVLGDRDYYHYLGSYRNRCYCNAKTVKEKQ